MVLNKQSSLIIKQLLNDFLKMSSISIMPLYYSRNVALIQIPISKRVADPRRLHSFSETEPQTARVREGWDAAVRERAFLAQRPLSAGWAKGCVFPTSPPIAAFLKNF